MDTTLRIERLALDGGIGKAEGIAVLRAEAEDGRGGRSIILKGWSGEAWGIAAETVLAVAEGEVVVKETDAAMHEELAAFGRRVCKAAAGAEDVVQIPREDMALLGEFGIGDLLREARSCAEMKVRETGAGERGVGVAEVIVANAVVDSELLRGLPGVFDEGAAGGLGVTVVIGLGFAGEGVVGEATFGVGVVVDEIDQAVELEAWLGVGGGEEGDVVAVEAFVTGLDRVRSVHVSQHIAPVVAVLDEVAKGKARAKAGPQRGDIHNGYGEVAGCGCEAFNAVVADIGLVEQVG